MSDGSARLPSIAPYAMPQPDEWPQSRAPWALEAGRAALLVHDMQAYFFDAFTPESEPVTSLVANIARLIEAARAADMPIFYTAQHGDQDRRDRGLQADLWGPGMRDIPAHLPIVAPLAPAPEDFVLVKHRYSAFQRSNLAELMRVRGRDQIILCGIYAHIGCLMTAAEAFQRDIEPFFAADALGDFSRDWHDMALSHAADCCAVLRSTAQITEDLA
ncbi:isochorismatase family protein [Altericroceibacterium spongiae]|uniref:Isochorismatase family protein n=1 Tax=Altericroceibacterium spongiae TaxID=2320269 RepID=A0A420EA93_9SPHN|nr:isochorismatase family protein [Altericroceibacterium spongiae]RKF17596.1 isochorismatase family protein [Altericroceibacterium spongiae]